MGRTQSMPVGIAPVGMAGVIWPGAEAILARAGAKAGVPTCLSTVASIPPEEAGPHIGDEGWFLLYAPADPEIRRDICSRAKDAGFHTLVLAADVPTASRRERLTRARVTNPMKITPRILAEVALAPLWAIEMTKKMRAENGVPRLRTLEKYADTKTSRSGTAHIGYQLRAAPDWAYLEALRKEWDGNLVVKGVLDPEAARRIADAGADAVWVSNHGGRQFDAAPASLEALEPVRAAVGAGVPIIYDGGVNSATDVLRAIAKGADFVMLGRAMQYAVAAMGQTGADHALDIMRKGLVADMGQMGLVRPVEARARLIR